LRKKDIRPAIIIKGLNFKLANKYINILTDYGIEEVIDLNKKNQPESNINMVKAACENQNVFSRITNKGYIRIENYKFRVVECLPKPTQCLKCFSFDHNQHVCNKNKLCKNCGNDYHENCRVTTKCINCNGEHHAQSRACPVFIKHRDIKHQREKERLANKDNLKQKTFTLNGKISTYNSSSINVSKIDSNKVDLNKNETNVSKNEESLTKADMMSMFGLFGKEIKDCINSNTLSTKVYIDQAIQDNNKKLTSALSEILKQANLKCDETQIGSIINKHCAANNSSSSDQSPTNI
jgi:hypothetical protein